MARVSPKNMKHVNYQLFFLVSIYSQYYGKYCFNIINIFLNYVFHVNLVPEDFDSMKKAKTCEPDTYFLPFS